MEYLEFGKLLEDLIRFSGQKNYSIAKKLGYDVSYISKWINLIMLPTSKNIDVICDKISDFMLENINKENYYEIYDYFQIDFDYDKEDLKEFIKNKLKQSYLYSKSKNQKNKNIPKTYNSFLEINPRFNNRVDKNIVELNEYEENEIIVMCDLFSLSKEEKMNIARIKKDKIDSNYISNTKIRFLINFDKESDNLIFDSILFIHMMNSYSSFDFNIYSYDCPSYTVMFVIRNKIFKNIIYNKNQRCLLVNKSNDKDIVEDAYYSLGEIINKESRPTFVQINHEKVILDKTYIQYIMGNDLQWIIGNINEFFMPSDLFLEIGKSLFDKKVLDELKKIDAILQNATYLSKINILMYESAIRKYISNGKLNFFNKEVVLDFNQRKRHIEYMEKIFNENKNINISLINGNLIEDFKNNQNPSLYTSKNLSLIRVKNEKHALIRDNRLHEIFNKVFDEVYKNKEDSLIRDKEEILSIISNSLKYATILNNSTIDL